MTPTSTQVMLGAIPLLIPDNPLPVKQGMDKEDEMENNVKDVDLK